MPKETILADKDSKTKYRLIEHKTLMATFGLSRGVLCSDIPTDGKYAIIFGKTDSTTCDDFKKWFEEQSHSDQDK